MSIRISLHDYARKRLRMAAMGLPSGFDPFGEDSPWFVRVDDLQRATAASGQSFLSLAHYDYLSLSRHPQVLEAAKSAIDRFGVGAGASRLIGGERSIHSAFESEISDFLGTEASLLIGTGYLVSLSLIPHLVGSGDLIVMDELIHSSSVHGAKGTRAAIRTFRHGDMDHLEQILREERENFGFCLVVAEGLYSMDGDVVDLPRLLALRDAWNAWLMIDEAHSIGVLGKSGRGICEHHGIDPSRVDLLVGTLSKTFVSMGGFISARREVIEWLKYTLPGFVFSVGLSPVIVETGRAALRLLRSEPERVSRLHAISEFFVAAAQGAGFSTGDAIGAGIVPILFDRLELTVKASRALGDAGIYVPPIVQVGMGAGASRLRFFLSSDVETDVVEHVMTILRSVA